MFPHAFRSGVGIRLSLDSIGSRVFDPITASKLKQQFGETDASTLTTRWKLRLCLGMSRWPLFLSDALVAGICCLLVDAFLTMLNKR